ncbi:hypothetical protein EV421DRAFT_1744185 [Armillaria borealis]|uniref:Uncharacterized protein n=1 Tax=Armillaria borealis TaxID=47425 RepID=A0AA39MDJ7_9AGAR|nr:hypothetical protein EV421DRAFT_1744185 [Armillaria borealis]
MKGTQIYYNLDKWYSKRLDKAQRVGRISSATSTRKLTWARSETAITGQEYTHFCMPMLPSRKMASHHWRFANQTNSLTSRPQVHLDYLQDEGLMETLNKGIGYFREAMDKQDKCIGQAWHGKEHQYIDYLIMDVLQVTDRAMMKYVLMCRQTRKTSKKKSLMGSLSIKHLLTHLLRDYILAAVVVKPIRNKQDAMIGFSRC